MRIRPISRSFRFWLWRILHPRRYARGKSLFDDFDEMHEVKKDDFKATYLSRRYPSE